MSVFLTDPLAPQLEASVPTTPSLNTLESMLTRIQAHSPLPFHTIDEPAEEWGGRLLDLMAVLDHTRPQMEENAENCLRRKALELISQLPFMEVHRPAHQQLFGQMLQLVMEDNEENAERGLRKITDLLRGGSGFESDSRVPQFLLFLRKLFLREIESFAYPLPSTGAWNSFSKARATVRSDMSFRILTEATVVAFVVFQSYPSFINSHLPPLIRAMFDFMDRELPTGKRESTAEDCLFAAQTRAASLVTYALRAYPGLLAEKADIPTRAVRLFLRCPAHSISHRRELFMVLRTIFETDFRDYFVHHVDHLLSDHVLLGDGPFALEARSVAYSTIADLIHTAKAKLSLDQIACAVAFFVRNLYDATLSPTLQTMSTKLLVHLVETVFKLTQSGTNIGSAELTKIRTVLGCIMRGFVAKLGAIANKVGGPSFAHYPFDPSLPIDSRGSDQILAKELRALPKVLILGLKNICYVLLTVFNSPVVGEVTRHLTSLEVRTFADLFKYGLQCLHAQLPEMDSIESVSVEDRENLENFSSLFVQLDEKTLGDLLKKYFPLLFECVHTNCAFMIIIQHFASSQNVARSFIDAMLGFLGQQLYSLASSPPAHRNAQISLFKTAYLFMPNNPSIVDSVRQHLHHVVQGCLRFALMNPYPSSYFTILVYLFRGVQQGKIGKNAVHFDGLLDEFALLAPSVLDLLRWALLATPTPLAVRDQLAELCLRLPVKPATAVPLRLQYLPTLFRYTIYALRSPNTDLVLTALKQLELWIDSSLFSSVEPVLQPFLAEILDGVSAHLGPHPANLGMAAMRILAKLGGRNRRSFPSPVCDETGDLEPAELVNSSVTFCIPFGDQNGGLPLSLLRYCSMVVRDVVAAVTGINQLKDTESAALFLCSCLRLCFEETPLEVSIDPHPVAVEVVTDGSDAAAVELAALRYHERNTLGFLRASVVLTHPRERLLHLAVTGVLACSLQPSLIDTSVLLSICQHFSRSTDAKSLLQGIASLFVLEAEAAGAGCQIPSPPPASSFLRLFHKTLTAAHPIAVWELSVWRELYDIFVQKCCNHPWHHKRAGAAGLTELASLAPSSWLEPLATRAIDALLFCLRDLPPPAVAWVRPAVTTALQEIARRTYTNCSQSIVPLLITQLFSNNAASRLLVQDLLLFLAAAQKVPASSLLETHLASAVPDLGHLPQPHTQMHVSHSSALAFLFPLFPGLTQKECVFAYIECALNALGSPIVGLRNVPEFEIEMLTLLSQWIRHAPIPVSPDNTELRDRILQRLFFALISPPPAAVSAAGEEAVLELCRESLKHALGRGAKEQTLLRSPALQPLVQCLSSPGKLTLDVVRSLLRLLSVCPHSPCWVKLAKETIPDLLSQWQDPKNILGLSKGQWPRGEERLIAAKLVELYQFLLPDGLPNLADLLLPVVLRLEHAWCEGCERFSPFRPALALAFAASTQRVEQFLQKLIDCVTASSISPTQPVSVPAPVSVSIGATMSSSPSTTGPQAAGAPALFWLLMGVVAAPNQGGIALRDALVCMSGEFIHRIATADESAKWMGLVIIRQVIRHCGQWPRSEGQVFLPLILQMWDIERRHCSIRGLDPFSVQPIHSAIWRLKLMVKILLAYCRALDDPTPVLMHLVPILLSRLPLDTSACCEYCIKVLPELPLAIRRSLLHKFATTTVHDASVLTCVALPILSREPLEPGLLDTETVAAIFSAAANTNFPTERMRIAALVCAVQPRLCPLPGHDLFASLIKYFAPQEPVPEGLGVSTFAQDRARCEDVSGRQAALQLAGRLVRLFDLPVYFMRNVFRDLLRPPCAETKPFILNCTTTVLIATSARSFCGFSHGLPFVASSLPQWIELADGIFELPQVSSQQTSALIDDVCSHLTTALLAAPIPRNPTVVDVRDLVAAVETREYTKIAQLIRQVQSSDSSMGPLYWLVAVKDAQVVQRFARVIALQATNIAPPTNYCVQWTLEFLEEETQSLPHLLHAFTIIARHSLLFYAARAALVPHLLSVLVRVTGASAELRKAAVDVVGVVLEWETWGLDSCALAELKRGGAPPQKKNRLSPNLSQVYRTLSRGQASYVISFLIRYYQPILGDISPRLKEEVVNTRQFRDGISSGELLRKAATLWPEAQIDFPSLEGLLRVGHEALRRCPKSPKDDVLTAACAGIQAISNLLHTPAFVSKSVLERLDDLDHRALLVPYFECPFPFVVRSLVELIRSVALASSHAHATANGNSLPGGKLLSACVFVIGEVLAAATATEPQKQCNRTSLSAPLAVLSEVSGVLPQFIEPHITLLKRVLSQLITEILSIQQEFQTQNTVHLQSPANRQLQTSSLKIQDQFLLYRDHLISVMSLLKGQQPDEGRRSHLRALLPLLDKCTDEILLVKATELIFSWLLQIKSPGTRNVDPKSRGRQSEQIPLAANRDRILLLGKLAAVDKSKRHSLQKAFFKATEELYRSGGGYHREASEFHAKTLTSLMAGLRTTGTLLRSVHETLSETISHDLYSRLGFVLDPLVWESLCDTFWITHALALLFGADGNTRSTNEALVCSANILGCLLSLARQPRYALPLWVDVFPAVWEALSAAQRRSLYQPLHSLMLSTFQYKQYCSYPNVIQALLQGAVRCRRNPIYIAPEVMKFLGKSFKAWNLALPCLEHRLLLLLEPGSPALQMERGAETLERLAGSLADLYRTLAEDDCLIGVWKAHGISPMLNRLVSLEQSGDWAQAQATLRACMSAYRNDFSNDVTVTGSELGLWEEHALAISKKLGQWDELRRYAAATQATPLLLECFWKKPDWKKMRDLFHRHPSLEGQLLKIYSISTAIMEGRLQEAEVYFQQGAQIALQRWMALPAFRCNSHITLLHNFQQLLELQETNLLLGKLSTASSGDVNRLFQKWRERIPNFSDDPSLWSDLLTWRQHVLRHLYGRLLSHPKLKDMSGSVLAEALNINVRLARVAWKHKHFSLANTYLQEAAQLAEQPALKDTPDAFASVFECIEWAFRQPDARQREMGWQELQKKWATKDFNYSRLPQHYKVQMLRLRGQYLCAMSRRDEANQAFSHAIESYDSAVSCGFTTRDLNVATAKAFLSWGKLCDQIFSINKEYTWGENALYCYFASLSHGRHPQHITARILLLFNSLPGECLKDTVEDLIREVPVWMWIPWMMHIFSGAHRINYQISCRPIVASIVAKYPQAIFYPIWASKPVLPCDCVAEAETEIDIPKIIAIAETTLRLHLPLVQELEINAKIFSSPQTSDEEFLRSLRVIYLRCFNYNANADEEVPKAVQQELFQLLKYQFHLCHPGTGGKNTSLRSFLMENRQEIIGDFGMALGIHQNVGKFKENVGKWFHKLRAAGKVFHRAQLDSEQRNYQGTDAEVPGQYSVGQWSAWLDCEPLPETHERVYRFDQTIRNLRDMDTSWSRFIQLTYSGRRISLVLQRLSSSSRSNHARCEERTWVVLGAVNHILEKRRDSKKRTIRLALPSYVPVGLRSRLVWQRNSWLTLQSVLDKWIKSLFGKADEFPIHQRFWDISTTLVGIPPADSRVECLRQIQQVVPDDILHQHLYSQCGSFDAFFAIRKQYATQTALWGLMAHLFVIRQQHINLDNIHISPTNGDIFFCDYLADPDLDLRDVRGFLSRRPAFIFSPVLVLRDSSRIRLSTWQTHWLTIRKIFVTCSNFISVQTLTVGNVVLHLTVPISFVL
eukprot:TRINITY_DN19125_c0_g1_i3.p1 TRINITY_DN19125_c0_g1~~TRINITY_DN19125_c0_g1_i3.p1  ORF type:complete len:3678 (+),score=312.38 TRINITY_DN19125_c0_g1_i3:152-11185(+)